MPIVDLSEGTATITQPPGATPVNPLSVSGRTFRTQKEMNTSALFSSELDITAVTQQVEGLPWTITYYSQIRGMYDEPLMPDIATSNTIQKYNRIDKLRIMLDSGLPENIAEEVTGNGIVNAGFIPNYGDPFIATLSGGREAMFVVTNVVKKMYNLNELYEIEFKLHLFIDTNVESYNDLLYKVVRSYVYDSNHITEQSAPILLDKEYKQKTDFKNHLPKLIKHYFKICVDDEAKVIAPPTTSSTYVDPLLDKFIFKLINSSDHPEVLTINKIPTTEEENDDYCVWDALINRDLDQLALANRDIGFKYTPGTSLNPVNRTANYLGINFTATNLNGRSPVPLSISTNRLYKEEFPVLVSNLTGTYAFTEAFYDGDLQNATVLERLMTSYLKGEIVDATELTTLLSGYKYWDYLDQYYYIPVLMLLVKAVTTKVYSEL